MKYLIILVVVFFGGKQAWETFAPQEQPDFGEMQASATIGSQGNPAADESYVAVYGRDRCGFTTAMLKKLEASGANYYYYSIDEQVVADNLHYKMRNAGVETKRYNLPVLDTNGSIQVRPKYQDVLEQLRAGA